MSQLRFLALAATLLLLPSCSLVVGGETPIPCVREQPNPCPSGLICIRRVCTPMDCDADRDGFGCDGVDDCDDTNANVYPGALEVCDGRDNNCDGNTDDNVCTEGNGCGLRGGEYQCLSLTDCYLGLEECIETELCDRETGRCGPPPTADCNVQPCPGTGRCNELTGICFEPLGLGQSCVRDLECSTNHCFPRASLGYLESGSLCSLSCASNADCTGTATGTCLVSGTGARGCVPTSSVTPPPACTRDAQCSTGSCRLNDTSFTFTCRIGGGAGTGELCDYNSDCASGACLMDENGLETICHAPCGVRSDCPRDEICRFRDTNPTRDVTWVTVCSDAALGEGEQGAPCTLLTSRLDCRERYCAAGEPRYCANLCTRDSECADGYTCRPVDNSGWELRCLRR